jgi:type IV pilus assembly protein PilY1
MYKKIIKYFCILSIALLIYPYTSQAMTLAQSPLLTLKTAPGLVMLTMGRDLTLYRAAYNDVNDIDGDGTLDPYFKPAFKYDGYFAYDRCYTYNTTSAMFVPTLLGVALVNTVDANKTYYKCNGSTWSGNFLNWLTMARIDVLRKVLYGGKRVAISTTTGSALAAEAIATTVLERTYVPQDSTLWGKEYTSLATDKYNINDYTPLALPTTGTRHIFANVTPRSIVKNSYIDGNSISPNPPYLFVYLNNANRVWDIAAGNNPILGATAGVFSPGSLPTPVVANSRLIVRVQTCVALATKYEDSCTGYPLDSTAPSSYKPTGLLQKYGATSNLAFGLLTGSYDNNYGGGVIRKNIDDFSNEINTNGTISSTTGIIYHLDRLRPWGFGNSTTAADGGNWYCNSYATTQRPNGECLMWGNPLGEMMYEGLNYFAGGSATSAFTTGVGVDHNAPLSGVLQTSPETPLQLKTPAWINPYVPSPARSRTAAFPICAKPTQIVIGNPSTTFDSDQLPGTAFPISPGFGSSSYGSLGTLNVGIESDKIWAAEFGSASKLFFVGESVGLADGNPSVKTVTSFKNIRGHAPDDTTGQGSFYGAAVARFGKATGITNPAVSGGKLAVDQISVALDSHIPKIIIPMNGRRISIVPISKTIDGTHALQYSPNYKTYRDLGKWQPTGAITAFYIKNFYNTDASNIDLTKNNGFPSYNFRIHYSDTDQGNDNETDAVAEYTIEVQAGNTLAITTNFIGGGNNMEMHIGFVISGGTTNSAGQPADGVYLEAGRAYAWDSGAQNFPVAYGYFLDTAPGTLPGSAKINHVPPYTDIPPILPYTSTRNFIVPTTPANSVGEYIPHDMLWYAAKHGSANYDTNGDNPVYKLKNINDPNSDPENYFYASNPSLLAEQIGSAFQKAAALSSVAVASPSVPPAPQIVGSRLYYTPEFETTNWSGNVKARSITAYGEGSTAPAWVASAVQPTPSSRNLVLGLGGTTTLTVTPSSYTSLPTAVATKFKNDLTFRYLLGERGYEKLNTGGTFRNRSSAFGDVANSAPVYMGALDAGYTDTSYAAFKATANPDLVAVGSNDGFFRLLSATTGVEKLAFMPQAAQTDIAKLADLNYTHQYYVDGMSGYGHVRNGTADTWTSVIASSTGAGSKSIFAVAASATGGLPTVLWEYQDSTYLGNVLNRPLVRQLANDVGAVLVGNGVNSALNQASLLVINATTGALIRTCTPSNAANASGNGMTAVAFVSQGGSGKVSDVYAGDRLGNIWRINPSDTACSNNARLIFSATSPSNQPQPVTGEISIMPAPTAKGAGYMLFFGTGSYVTTSDPTDNTIQTMYGLWYDNGTSPTIAKSALLEHTYKTPSASSGLNRTTTTRTDFTPPKAWFDVSGKQGWMLNLTCTSCPAGERHIDQPVLETNGSQILLKFLTMVPGTDPCVPSGQVWETALDPISGDAVLATTDLTLTENARFIPKGNPKGLTANVFTPHGSDMSVSGTMMTVFYKLSDGPPSVRGSYVINPECDANGNCQAQLITKTRPPATAATTRLHRQVWRQLQ